MVNISDATSARKMELEIENETENYYYEITTNICQDNLRQFSNASNSFMYILNGPVITLLVIVGFITNSLTIFVFCRASCKFQGLKPYWIMLASWNMIMLITGWLFIAVPTYAHRSGAPPLYGHLTHLYFILYPITNMASMGSAMNNVCASIELYIAICKPIVHRMACHIRRTILILVVGTLCVIILNLPRFFDFALDTCVTPDNVTQISFEMKLAGIPTYFRAYVIPVQFIFVSVGPILIMICAGTQVLWSVFYRYSRDVRQAGSVSSPSLFRRHGGSIEVYQQQIARLVICIIAKYVIFNALPCVMDVVHVLALDNLMENESYYVTADVSNAIVMLHASTEFFVYFLCQPQFRRACHPLRPTGRNRSVTIERTPATLLQVHTVPNTPALDQAIEIELDELLIRE